jgi:hypothetical protein
MEEDGREVYGKQRDKTTVTQRGQHPAYTPFGVQTPGIA